MPVARKLWLPILVRMPAALARRSEHNLRMRTRAWIEDEYDGYVGRVYELLVSKAPQSELINYLYWAAHDHMGLDAASRSHMTGTVEALNLIPLD